MADTYAHAIQHIRDGEPVDSNVSSRPDRALEARQNYLLDRVNAASLGERAVAAGVALEADAAVGMPVYWNADNGTCSAPCADGHGAASSAPWRSWPSTASPGPSPPRPRRTASASWA